MPDELFGIGAPTRVADQPHGSRKNQRRCANSRNALFDIGLARMINLPGDCSLYLICKVATYAATASICSLVTSDI